MNHKLARRILYMFEDDGKLRLTYEGVAEIIGANPEETRDTLRALVDLGELGKDCESYYRNLAYADGRRVPQALAPRIVPRSDLSFLRRALRD